MGFLDDVLRVPDADGYRLTLDTGEPWPPPVLGDPGCGPPALRALLAKTWYKRGWQVTVGPNEAYWTGRDDGSRSPFEWCLKVVTAPVEDAYGSGRRSPVVTVTPLPYVGDLASEEEWAGWLWHTLSGLEVHEAGEWFAVDGKRPFNPHK